jgi:hypothetical protein
VKLPSKVEYRGYFASFIIHVSFEQGNVVVYIASCTIESDGRDNFVPASNRGNRHMYVQNAMPGSFLNLR